MEFLLNEVLKVSSMSDYEYMVLMTNHYIFFSRKDWDCNVCLKVPDHIIEKGGESLEKAKKSIEGKRVGLGCAGADRTIVTLDKFVFTKCPGNIRNSSVVSFYEMYRIYRSNGVLPYPGSMSEQPAKIFDFFQVFNWLDDVAAEKEQRRLKRK